MSGPDDTRKPGGVEDTLRDFWATRPVRPRRGGKLGGVSAAVGHRYGIDPVLVRVAFVVLTFYGGAGVMLYLLGWLLLPKEDTPTNSPPSMPMIVLLVLLLVPASFAVSDAAGLFGLALGGLAVYLLHRNHRRRDPVEPPRTEQSGTGNTWVYPTVNSGAEQHATAGTTEQEGPPSWDPLGAAPFAWDLPDPGEPQAEPEPEPPRPRRRSVTLVTLAIALLAIGFGTAFGLPVVTTTAVTLGVLGGGMVVGAFLHGGRGLIGFAVPVAALALLLNVLPGATWYGVSNQEVRPNGVAEIRDTYRTSVGNIELHLDDLRFPEGRTITTTTDVGLGNVSVYLPPNVDVRATCSVDTGATACLDDQRSGNDVSTTTIDHGADGRGGGQIVLDLHAGTGNVEVFRG